MLKPSWLGSVKCLIGILLGWTMILSCVPLIIWFVCIYWGVQAYNGKTFEIPVVTNFVKNQGWA